MINKKLLRQYVAWVKREEKLSESKRRWRQDVWLARETRRAPACQTYMCLAGKVALDAGWKPLRASAAQMRREGKYIYQFDEVVKGGVRGTVYGVAEQVLGLPDGHALFLADNTAADIAEYAEDLIARETEAENA